VLKVAYFRLNFSLTGGEAGYVIHERPQTYLASLCISAAPLVVNSALAFIVVAIAHQFHPDIGQEGPGELFLLWLGFSIGAHAFPSNQDMSNVTDHAAGESQFIRGLSNFLYITMCILNALKVFWLDFVYSFLIVWLIYWPL